ncbi:Por secretion system C-terminal sorting domain-containing protein [Mariniphaga anaerophila]|uniref:Por secretion system C-terminal sorting domain-containing protein n=1 Tax=Mariniphaga anaerophila TaxID=1484053 RepID=A0A1M4W133_9BACT|nr:hypothetical protein [Mariniphaga anaerophila]SHE74958.1 Por secretion system C-terminal sorting domain-containing protein [Mariniphaga anaerophila]
MLPSFLFPAKAALPVFLLFSVLSAGAQEFASVKNDSQETLEIITWNSTAAEPFNYEIHPVMDPYSVVDPTRGVYGGADFHNMDAQQKEDFFQSRIKANVRKINNGYYNDCVIYSKVLQLNFTGLENFTNFGGVDDNQDGLYEGYDYYNPLVELGKENLPLYLIGTTTSDGRPHMIVGAYTGPKEKGIEHDATKWNQWSFWNFEDGEKIVPAYGPMDPNGPCEIMQLIYKPHTDLFSVNPILSFKLENGVGILNKTFGEPGNEQGYDPRILRDNAHQSKVKLSQIENKIFTDKEDIYFEDPAIETNIKHYSPTLERILSDTIKTSPNYYSFKVTDIAKYKIGRWNTDPTSPTFLKNLSDTSSYIVTVDLTSGIEELQTENKKIDLDFWGDSKLVVSTKDYLRQGEIYIYDMNGKTIDVLRVNDLMPGEERQINYSGFLQFVPGVYSISFIGNGSVATVKFVNR